MFSQHLAVLASLSANLDAMSTQEQVDIGLALQECLAATKKTLDAVKQSLRLEATFEDGARSSSLKGSLGVCVVSAPETILKIAPGSDIPKLRSVLGPTFQEFFDVQTTIVPARRVSPDTVAALTSGQAQALGEVVVAEKGVGGVSFLVRK